jgi:hypothetical protein
MGADLTDVVIASRCIAKQFSDVYSLDAAWIASLIKQRSQ